MADPQPWKGPVLDMRAPGTALYDGGEASTEPGDLTTHVPVRGEIRNDAAEVLRISRGEAGGRKFPRRDGNHALEAQIADVRRTASEQKNKRETGQRGSRWRRGRAMPPAGWGGAPPQNQAPASVIPSTRMVGASVPRRNSRSFAARMAKNISVSLPAMVISPTGSASLPSRIMKPAAPRE